MSFPSVVIGNPVKGVGSLIKTFGDDKWEDSGITGVMSFPHVTRLKHSSASFSGKHSDMTGLELLG